MPHSACHWVERSLKYVLPLPARYFHKGSLAYVGGDQAVMDIPKVGPILGREAGVMWKGYETFAQVGKSSAQQVPFSLIACICNWVSCQQVGTAKSLCI